MNEQQKTEILGDVSEMYGKLRNYVFELPLEPSQIVNSLKSFHEGYMWAREAILSANEVNAVDGAH